MLNSLSDCLNHKESSSIGLSITAHDQKQLTRPKDRRMDKHIVADSHSRKLPNKTKSELELHANHRRKGLDKPSVQEKRALVELSGVAGILIQGGHVGGHTCKKSVHFM